MDDVCDPSRNPGYSWVWWFGPFEGHADCGDPISLRSAKQRLAKLFTTDGPDSGWLNIY